MKVLSWERNEEGERIPLDVTEGICKECGQPYEVHPFSGILTCFLHPSPEEQAGKRLVAMPTNEFWP